MASPYRRRPVLFDDDDGWEPAHEQRFAVRHVRREPAALAALLGLAGSVLMVLGLLAWWTSSHVLAEAEFADSTVEAFHEEPVREEAARQLVAQLIARHPQLAGARSLLVGTTVDVMHSEPFFALVRAAAADVHRSIFEGSADGPLVLDLSGTYDLLAEQVVAVNPSLAQFVPDDPGAGLIELDRARGAADAVDRFERLIALGRVLPLFALGFYATALLAAPRRSSLLSGLSLASLLGALMVLLSFAPEPAARAMSSANTAQAATAAFSAFTSTLWVWLWIAMAAAGVLVLLGGALAFARREPARW